MPSQPYNLVKDDQDLRVPLHSDEAFYTGISFNAKVRKRDELLTDYKLKNFLNGLRKTFTFMTQRKKKFNEQKSFIYL